MLDIKLDTIIKYLGEPENSQVMNIFGNARTAMTEAEII